MTARAMSATRRMYSTMLAPRSVAVNLAWSHVRRTNRFMVLPLLSTFVVLATHRGLAPRMKSAGPFGDLDP